MSRSIGGQSRVYQPVSGGVPGGRRANVLTPADCTFTESFNKADGSLGPDLAWTVPALPGSQPNEPQVADSQFATLISYTVFDESAWHAQAIMATSLCSVNCYAEATITKYDIDLVTPTYPNPYVWVGLVLRSNGDESTTGSSYSKLWVGNGAPDAFNDPWFDAFVDLARGTPSGYPVYDGTDNYTPNGMTLAVGDRIRFEAQNNTYRGFVNDTLVVSHTETGAVKPRDRRAGLFVDYGYDDAADIRLDAFEAGNL